MNRSRGVAGLSALSALVITVSILLAGAPPVANASAATSTTTPTKVTNCRSTNKVLCVLANSNGKDLRAQKGEEVEFVLQSSGQRYSGLHQIGRELLREVSKTTSTTGAVVANYVAITTGHAQFEATAAPICALGQACPQYILLWRVAITISK